MRVRLVTTWDQPCGVSEHAFYLKQSVEATAHDIVVEPDPVALDPAAWRYDREDILHLNYHAALHSRWQPETIRLAQQIGVKVLVTYHDSGVPNSEQCKSIVAAADQAVIHEPFEDLPAEKVTYCRMGVPDWEPYISIDRTYGTERYYGDRPILGTIGFPFPWKCYDELAKTTAKAGWGLFLIAPNATIADVDRWAAINPKLQVITHFCNRRSAIGYLSGCDATAFTYVTHNTGQSGAILQGIAARKPVIALSTCRQFRALLHDPLGHDTIRWVDTFEEVLQELRRVPIQRVDPGIVALAEQESWTRVGEVYADLYRRLLA